MLSSFWSMGCHILGVIINRSNHRDHNLLMGGHVSLKGVPVRAK